ncbi:MAG: septal ring lytic transglycosylase RlpA family protein [Deltaproteobacteria bacterium]|nr:septal ring lytic transglycosylase RlpA family protein [Deltaproteobacteria bacterium]
MKRVLWIFLILIVFWGCAPKREVKIPPPKVPPVTRRVEYGWASWYGRQFHGRRTSSGEVYNMYQLTAAHRALPMGIRVVVTHLKNGRSVMVTINDRGPFVKGRIIDLSYAAAQVLGMVEEGVAWVRVEPLGKRGLSPLPAEGPFTIQVGSFILRSNALRLMEELKKVHKGAYIAVLKTPENRYYRVRLGRFSNREEAYQFAMRLAKNGYTPFITKTE